MILKIAKNLFLNTRLIFPVDGEEVKEKEILVVLRVKHKICYWEKKALILEAFCLEN